MSRSAANQEQGTKNKEPRTKNSRCAAPHSELIQAKKATSVGLADSAVRIFYAELSKDVAHMGGYGILADAQALCDRLFAKPFGKEDDHLILSSGERLYSMRVFFINRCWDHFVLAS